MTDQSGSPARLSFHHCEAQDLDAVMTVMETSFDARFGEAWTRSQCAGILPLSGVALTLVRNRELSEPLGFSLRRTVADEAELLLIAVIPSARQCGVGRALLDHFIASARAEGAQRLHLEVRDGNEAVALYTAGGFKAAGRRRQYYRGLGGDLFDALTLVLEDQ